MCKVSKVLTVKASKAKAEADAPPAIMVFNSERSAGIARDKLVKLYPSLAVSLVRVRGKWALQLGLLESVYTYNE